MLKNNKGVSLITLVVTIIVMLIIAGVVIGAVIGEDRILEQTTTAEKEIARGELEEIAKMAVTAEKIRQPESETPLLANGVVNQLANYGVETNDRYQLSFDDINDNSIIDEIDIWDRKYDVSVKIVLDEEKPKVSIDGEVVDFNESYASEIFISTNQTEPGESVKITVIATCETGIDIIELPNGTQDEIGGEKTGITEYIVYEKGKYKFIVTGTEPKTDGTPNVKTVYVDVDEEDITLENGITIDVGEIEPTNQPVSTTITFDGDESRAEYTIDSNTWLKTNGKTATFQVTENISIGAQYRYPVIENDENSGKIYGNITKQISHIDTEKPNDFEIIAIPSASTIDVTGQTTDIGSVGTSPEYIGIQKYEFRLTDENGAIVQNWVEDTTKQGKYIFTDLNQNTVYVVYEKVTDLAGNVLEKNVEVTTSGVPDGDGNITITANPTGYTNQSVNVKLTTATSYDIQYQIGTTTGIWQDYNYGDTGFEVHENTTIYGRLKENDFLFGKSTSLDINNIDKISPVEKDVFIKLNELNISAVDYESGIGKYIVNISDESKGDIFTEEIETDETTIKINIERYRPTNDETYTINIEVYDKAGNKTTMNERTLYQAIPNVIHEIEPTSWTNEEVVIRPTNNPNNYYKFGGIIDSPIADVETVSGEEVTVVDNNTNVQLFYTDNNTGEEGVKSVVNIQNIDRLLPNTPEIKLEEVRGTTITITINGGDSTATVADGKSGVERYEIYINNLLIDSITFDNSIIGEFSNSINITGISGEENNIKVVSFDFAGNESQDSNELNIRLSEEEPILSNGMIPIKISEDWSYIEKADVNLNWHDYNNKQWANVALVTDETREKYETAEAGIEINEEDILHYYVWLPRFEYKTGTINEVNTISIDAPIENGEFNTHSAFTTNDGKSLAGIWVAKFNFGTNDSDKKLVSSDISTNEILNTRGISELRYSDNGEIYASLINELNDNNNIFGLNNQTVDSRILSEDILNAINIFSNSKYGDKIQTSTETTTENVSGIYNLSKTTIEQYDVTVKVQGDSENRDVSLGLDEEEKSDEANNPPVILTIIQENATEETPFNLPSQYPEEKGDGKEVTGQIAAADPEGKEVFFVITGTGDGAYGEFLIDVDTGLFAYTINSEKSRTILKGESVTESFYVAIRDPEGNITTTTISFVIQGGNNLPMNRGVLINK